MTTVVYLGEELGCAGYRLAGVLVRETAPADAETALDDARGKADVVLVAASLAACVRAGVLDAALAALSPLTLVVPDVASGAAAADVSAGLRAELGLAEEG